MTINTEDELFISGMNTLHSSSTKSGFVNQTSVQSDYDKTFFRTEVNEEKFQVMVQTSLFDQHITIYLDHKMMGLETKL